MFTESDTLETEPPLSTAAHHHSFLPVGNDDADLMLAAAPPRSETHALVIGRHTLEPILTLMKSGCESVEAHTLAAPASHHDQASLAWITDIETAAEVETAVHQAATCLSAKGCMVLDATALARRTAVVTVLRILTEVGFRLRSVLPQGNRLILVAVRRAHLALAA